jgi:hypothetical protein
MATARMLGGYWGDMIFDIKMALASSYVWGVLTGNRGS